MTTFKSAIAICGLSMKDAAEFLDVRYDTAKSWSQGRNAPPMGVWRDLSDLYARLENAANLGKANLEPGHMPLRIVNSLQADDGVEPLPGHGPDTAGAMALLLAVRDFSRSESLRERRPMNSKIIRPVTNRE